MTEANLNQLLIDTAEMRRDIQYIKEKIEENHSVMSKLVSDHEERIRILEQFRWLALGAVSNVSSLLTFFLTKIFQ